MTQPETTPSYTPAQARILEASLALFDEFGVAGTSLQMIADKIGVTKAAVYHQFPVKDDIVLAIGHMVLDQIRAMLLRAEQESTLAKRRDLFLEELVQLAVDSRDMAGFLHQDPVMLRLFNEHAPFRETFEKIDTLLLGNSQTEHANVTVAVLVTAIGGTVRYPLVRAIDNDTLKRELLAFARLLIQQIDNR